jgi:hypothetical protein
MSPTRFAATLLLAVVVNCSGPGSIGKDDAGVKAILYPMWVTVDVTHGYGTWINEIYLPDAKVVCNVTWEATVSDTGSITDVSDAHAFFGSLEERRDGTLSAQKSYAWTQEEVMIPGKLAQQIIALAELDRRERAMKADVGSSLSKALGLAVGGGMHPLPSDD